MENKKCNQISSFKKRPWRKMQSDKIIKKYKELFDALENYDKTRELPTHRKRIDVTLSVRTINKLKEIKEKTGKSVSELIEESVNKCWIIC